MAAVTTASFASFPPPATASRTSRTEWSRPFDVARDEVELQAPPPDGVVKVDVTDATLDHRAQLHRAAARDAQGDELGYDVAQLHGREAQDGQDDRRRVRVLRHVLRQRPPTGTLLSHVPANALPDLVPLPSWGISTSHVTQDQAGLPQLRRHRLGRRPLAAGRGGLPHARLGHHEGLPVLLARRAHRRPHPGRHHGLRQQEGPSPLALPAVRQVRAAQRQQEGRRAQREGRLLHRPHRRRST